MRVKTRRQKTTYVESSRIVVSCESVCPRVWRMALLLVAFKKRKKLRTKTLFFRHTLCARGAALTLTALPRVPRRIYGFTVKYVASQLSIWETAAELTKVTTTKYHDYTLSFNASTG